MDSIEKINSLLRDTATAMESLSNDLQSNSSLSEEDKKMVKESVNALNFNGNTAEQQLLKVNSIIKRMKNGN